MAMTTDNAEAALAELLEIVCAAIEIGDWTVDGRCDPDVAVHRAEQVLRDSGWTKNNTDGSWVKRQRPNHEED